MNPAFLLLLTSPAAQQPIDATLPANGPLSPFAQPLSRSLAQPHGGSAGGGRAAGACDDFDRGSGTAMGPDWNEVSGDFGIDNNQARAFSTGYMIHTGASAGVFGSDMSVDFEPYVTGSNLRYVALISGYSSSANNVFIKVQDNNSDGLYDRVFFYGGINGGNWGQNPYYFDLATPTGSGSMDVHFTNGGDTANLDITNHASGAVEHFESDGLLSSGMIFGLEFGIGAFNQPYFDNYEVNDGCGPSLDVSNLIAGATATVTVSNATPGGTVGVAYSLTGPGPSSASAGPCGSVTVDLSPPIQVLPLLTADAAGTATLNQAVPAGTTGVAVWIHALDLGTCTLTNSLAEIIG